MEIWADIEGYEGYYQVSNQGNVRSLTRVINGRKVEGKLMKWTYSTHGYPQVRLSMNGKSKTVTIHTLVATNFVDNPKNLSEVNHIDHNKHNATYTNLEWCTRSENMKAMRDFYGIKKKVNYCKCGNEVYKEGNSCKDCHTKSRRTVERPPKEKLIRELSEGSFSSVGRKYGVSDNAIRKWCKSYKLPTKSRAYH